MVQVSVLLPNYNNAPYLRECLDSLRDQTFKDFVVIFVDDCSTDNSLQIVSEYTGLRFKILTKENNSGIVDTLNIGLDVIESKYMIRMDGDDISHPLRFEKLVNFMEKNPEIGVCSSDIKTFGISNEIWQFESDPEMNKAKLIFGHGIGHASSIFRMTLFREHKIRYENTFWRMEDYDLFYRLRNLTSTTNIDECLYMYRKGSYNENPEINQKRLTQFEKIYTLILSQTGMKIDSELLRVHMELNRLFLPSKSIRVYKKHCDEIMRSNLRTKNLPHQKLRLVLKNNLRQMAYRLLDANKISFIESIPFLLSNEISLRYYLKSMKINRGKK